MADKLDIAMTAMEAVDVKPFEIIAEQCVQVRNRNASCNQCVQACPTKAISISRQSILVDWDACCGCLVCTLACPTQALCNVNPSDDEAFSSAFLAFKERASQDKAEDISSVYLMCSQAQQHHLQSLDIKCIGAVSCVSQIDESLLIGLASFGAKNICVIVDDCDSCKNFANHGGARAVANLACKIKKLTNKILSAYDTQIQLGITTKLPTSCKIENERDFDASRRNMFGQLKERMGGAMGAAMTQWLNESLDKPQKPSIYDLLRVNEEGTLPVFIPSRRKVLQKALKQLGTPNNIKWNVRLWGYPAVDDDCCIGCSMCSTFCPSGALRIVQSKVQESQEKIEDSCYEPEEPDRLLIFHADRCLKCRTCGEICIAHAIEFSDTVFAQDIALGNIEILKVIKPAE